MGRRDEKRANMIRRKKREKAKARQAAAKKADGAGAGPAKEGGRRHDEGQGRSGDREKGPRGERRGGEREGRRGGAGRDGGEGKVVGSNAGGLVVVANGKKGFLALSRFSEKRKEKFMAAVVMEVGGEVGRGRDKEMREAMRRAMRGMEGSTVKVKEMGEGDKSGGVLFSEV